jgi:predicted nucleic-acid-binding protein
MRAVDTNVLVRLITRDELRQATAADAFIEPGAWVSVVALTEAIWVLDAVYKLSSAQLIKCLEMLLSHKNLTIQDADVVTAALELFRTKPALGFSDCLICEISLKAGHLPLGTFDRGLSKLPGTQRL